MARIRTIKPEFPQSESMGRISREARLLFLMLFTVVDDSGVTRGNSRMLASLLYPYDDDASALIDKWINELMVENCIVKYVVDNQTYIQICKWLNHQKIDKPTPSKLPQFDNAREDSRILPVGLYSIGKDSIGKERKVSAKKSDYPDEFLTFWEYYPNKTGKKDALKSWLKEKPLLDNVLKALSWQVEQEQWKKDGGKFIPNPSTYLNQHRWEDEPSLIKKPLSFTEQIFGDNHGRVGNLRTIGQGSTVEGDAGYIPTDNFRLRQPDEE